MEDLQAVFDVISHILNIHFVVFGYTINLLAVFVGCILLGIIALYIFGFLGD